MEVLEKVEGSGLGVRENGPSVEMKSILCVCVRGGSHTFRFH